MKKYVAVNFSDVKDVAIMNLLKNKMEILKIIK